MAEYSPEEGAARADLGRFIAACYYQPGPEFAEEGLLDSMLAAAHRIDDELATVARRLGEQFAAEAADRLLIDYTQLFLGPTHIAAKPYGSVWLTGEKSLMQDETMAILALYEEGGVEMDEEFRELPDHVAAELEFLYLLIHRENQARLAGDAGTLAAAAALRRRLLDEHLGRWIDAFAAAVRDTARTAFYRELAGLTTRFVELERRRTS